MNSSVRSTSVCVVVSMIAISLAGCAQNQASGDMQSDMLKERLDAQKAEFNRDARAETVRVYEEGIREVRRSGVIETAKKKGDIAPNFELPNATGKPVQLYKLLREGPVVLVWYRGGWCPYCQIQLDAYQEMYPKVRDLGAHMLAISPQLPMHTLDTKQKLDLGYEVLSDHANITADRYGIVYTLPSPVVERLRQHVDLARYNGNRSNELPLAAVYIVGQDRKIKYAYIDADYRKRAEPADILKTLRKLQMN